VVTAYELNLRSAPGVHSEVISVLKEGNELQMSGSNEEGNWLSVEYEGTEGWVAARYVELSVPLGTLPVSSSVRELPVSPTTDGHGMPAQVLRVIDGDTIEVSVNGDTYTVRHIAIDTPETKHPDKPVEWMGEEAAAANEALVGDKRVELEKE